MGLERVLICLSAVLWIGTVMVQSKILQVQVLSRHCDRTTVHEDEVIPKDAFNWMDSFGLAEGQLTGLGQQQCQTMGDNIRYRYLDESSATRINGISSKYNQTLFHFRSTDVDRTLMSIWSVSMGLFPQGTGYDVIINNNEPNLGFALPNGTQAIPIHTEAKPTDGMLRGFELCNTVDKRKKAVSSGAWAAVLSQYREFLDELYTVTGWTKGDAKLHILFDLLQTQYSHKVLNLNWVINNWETLDAVRNKLVRLENSHDVIGRYVIL